MAKNRPGAPAQENRLLARLPEEERRRLLPLLEPVTLEFDSGETPAQRRRDRGRMRVPRWLARRYVDPRGLAGAHGLADASGDVSIASATR